jgi:hypothetical protein
MPERYDLGPLSQLSMPSETKARKLSNLQRQQAMQLNAAQEQRAAALAPHQLEASRLGNLATQQNIAASKQNIATAQQQNKLKLAEAYQKVGNLASQTWYAVKRKYGDDPEALNMHRRNLVGSVTNVMSKLPGGTQAAEKFKAKVAEDPSFLDTMAAQYEATQTAKRGGTPTSSEGPRDSKNPETGLWHKESRVTFDPSTQSYKTTYVGQGHAKEEDLYRGEGLKEEAKQAAKTWGGKGGVVETAEASIPELQSARASMEQFQALNEETPTGFGAELGYKATALLNFLAPSRVRDNDAANAAALRTVSMDMLAARFNMAKGAISDMEFSAFANSIPSLMNSERGNDLIIATMRQLNDFSFERAMAIRRINSGPGDSQDKKELLREFDEMQRKAIKAAGKALKKEVEEIKKSQSRAYTIGDLISSIKGEAVTGRPTPPSEYPPEVQEDLLQGF